MRPDRAASWLAVDLRGATGGGMQLHEEVLVFLTVWSTWPAAK
jgi:hypothetical protein